MSRNAFILSLAVVALIASALLISTRFEAIALADEVENIGGTAQQESVSYRVRAGDNLYRISEDFYGNPRLWQVIANENGFSSAVDLKAGQDIRIPVLSRDQIDAASPAISAGQSSLPDMRPDPTLASAADADRADADRAFFRENIEFSSSTFENVNATIQSIDGKANLRITAVVGDFYQELFNEDIRPIGGEYRYAFHNDANRDGRDEVYTVWQVGNDPYFTKEIAWDGTRFVHSATHPNAPFAMEYDPQVKSASDSIERFMNTGSWKD